MEQGNEGDEIILLAFRQIGCTLSNEVNSVGQLTADMLIEIVARSLLLISNGEVNVSVHRLPILFRNLLIFSFLLFYRTILLPAIESVQVSPPR